MDLAQLQLFCREVHEELSQVTQEIELQSENDCEQEVLAMLKSSAEHFLIEKRQYRDQLRHQCEAILGELRKKKALIGYQVNEDETGSQSMTVAPPYKPLVDKLMLDLEQLNSEVSERSHRRSKQWTKIRDLCDKMAMPPPLLSDSLAESDLAEYESTADSLQQEFARRLKSAQDLISKISTISEYLGDDEELQLKSDEDARLDIEFMTSLERKYQSLFKQYEERKEAVEAIETRITALASALEVPPELPCASGRSGAGTGAGTGAGAGSDDRLKLLKQREAEMNALRLERIDVFIQNSRNRIYALWDKLFLDMRLRNSFEGRVGNEELLEDVDREVQRLEKMLLDPSRQPILASLTKYQQIKENEAKLDEMSHDPGRLARRGFAASLKQEERLRRFNSKFKPEVLETLATLCKLWSEQHNGETFSINGRDVSVVLAEESANAPIARRRQSLPPRRAAAPQSSDTKRPRSYTESRKPLTSVSPSNRPPVRPLPLKTARVQPVRAPPLRPPSLRPPSLRPQSQAPQAQAPQAQPPQAPPPQAQPPQAQVPLRRPPTSRSKPYAGISKPAVPSRLAAATRRPPRPVVSRPTRALPINLPRSTPGGPRATTQRHADKENIPAPPSWESEEYMKMQNLEMSYFDETAIPDTSITRQSFDYDRDAF